MYVKIKPFWKQSCDYVPEPNKGNCDGKYGASNLKWPQKTYHPPFLHDNGADRCLALLDTIFDLGELLSAAWDCCCLVKARGHMTVYQNGLIFTNIWKRL